jgi:hypothetical protein
MNPTRLVIPLVAMLAIASLASAGLVDTDGGRLVVVGDDGGQATVTFEDGRLQVVAVDDGAVSVHEFDMTQLGELIDGAVAQALAGLDGALDEDLSIRVEDGTMIHVSHGDRACAVNLQILGQEIRNSLSAMHVEIGRELRHADGVGDADGQDELEDLQSDLEELKAELDSLRDDLDRVR